MNVASLIASRGRWTLHQHFVDGSLGATRLPPALSDVTNVLCTLPRPLTLILVAGHDRQVLCQRLLPYVADLILVPAKWLRRFPARGERERARLAAKLAALHHGQPIEHRYGDYSNDIPF